MCQEEALILWSISLGLSFPLHISESSSCNVETLTMERFKMLEVLLLLVQDLRNAFNSYNSQSLDRFHLLSLLFKVEMKCLQDYNHYLTFQEELL